MSDYGIKLLEAYQMSTKTQIVAIETILFGQPKSPNLGTDYELDSFGDLPKQIPIAFDSPSGIKNVVVYNNLGKTRYQLVKLVVTTPYIEVIGPDGEYVPAQVRKLMSGPF
jgi:hypothetical protein